MELSSEQLRDIIFNEQKDNVSAAACHRRLCDLLSHNIISLRIVE